MTPSRDLVVSLEAELLRCSQRLGEQEVLPDHLRARLPEAVYGRWAPVLDQVVAEVGEELLDWARQRGSRWYRGEGPRLEVELSDVAEARVEAGFSSSSP